MRMDAATAVFLLDTINAEDPEKAHSDADALLLACVPKAVRDAYERLVARSDWWASS